MVGTLVCWQDCVCVCVIFVFEGRVLRNQVNKLIWKEDNANTRYCNNQVTNKKENKKQAATEREERENERKTKKYFARNNGNE